ncbi:uncharacterized protein [Apostichopus japonicus]|uniref:uncharacterized protein n=1 Tax=Stichopus japonicus TaxID=307972 RepID=UPI003AB49F9F
MASKERDDQVRVFLWALPRSVSTAMTKCMSFVDEAQIWFEPYLYSYHNEKFRDPAFLQKFAASKKGSMMEKAMKEMKPVLEATPRGNRLDNDLFEFSWVKTQLENEDLEKKVIFVKDMAHVLNQRYEHLPIATSKFRHTFLIRDPHRMYPSFRKMMGVMLSEDEKETMDITKEDAFYDTEQIYKYTYDLWKYTKENLDPDALIIDGTELTTHPEKLLPKYFEALGIPYKAEYLQWDENPEILIQWKASFESLVGAYLANLIKSAAHSTHFIPEAGEPPSRESLTPDVIKCIDASFPYYNEMFEHRIKP